MHKTLKIGHRGAKGYEPENTLISFQKALDLNVDGIELDVHLSSDGHLIVIHDESIDRTTNGKGFVNQLSLKEIKAFLIEDKFTIPTLEEVFDLIDKKCFINVELKSFETAEKVVQLIEKYINEKNWKYSHFLVSSFDWNALQQVRFMNTEIPIGVLTETELDLAFSFAKFIKAASLHPYFEMLTPENALVLQEEGIRVIPWTVNNPKDLLKMQSLKVNGIITDFPDRI